MRLGKYILILFLLIATIPILSIIVLSFHNTTGNPFSWYFTIWKNEAFISAFILSTGVSIIATCLGITISFILSLSWYNKNQLKIMIILILILGLLPPDILSLSISNTFKIIGFNTSNLFLLIFGQIFYIIPFGIIIYWVRFYFIDISIIKSAQDIGMRNLTIALKVLLPLSKQTSVTGIIFGFLLVFNEYPRTYYLSGSNTLLSEYLYGKLSSGTNESIFAGGSITILITVFLILIYAFLYFVNSKKKYM
jgi:ABC-type spermidine/putrescine transport system permease subunit II